MIYRGKFRKDGTLASVTAVESQLQNGERIFYVEAHSKEEAIGKLQTTFWRISRRAGMCPQCGKRPPEAERNLCRPCLDKAVATKRQKLSLVGNPVLLAERAARFKQQNLEHLAAARARGVKTKRDRTDRAWDAGREPNIGELVALRQALRAYDRDPAGFRDWLVAVLEAKWTVARRQAQAAE